MAASGDPQPTAADTSRLEVLGQAEHWLSLGDRDRALEVLDDARSQIETSPDPRIRALAASLRGRAWLQLGRFADAEPQLQRALQLAEATPLPELAPLALNDLGLLHSAIREDDRAQAEYHRGIGLAEAAHDSAMAMRLRLNWADLHLRRRESGLAQEQLEQVLAELPSLPASPERIGLANALATRLLSSDPNPGDEMSLGRLLTQTLEDASARSDLRGQSQAQGEIGQLQARGKDKDAALASTRRAMRAASAAHAPELLYRWQWQAARLMAARGEADEALAFYERAVNTLQPIRHDLLEDSRSGYSSYRGMLAPLFEEYADLLLRPSAPGADASRRQQRLRRARDIVEQLKTVELEDYFQEDCAARFEARRRDVDEIVATTAVIYPIVLPDRLELLLGLRGELQQFTVAVPGRTLANEAGRLRKFLVRRNSDQYLASAQQLHQWLIAPLEEALRAGHVDTLLVVPDGPLLEIPFAALHDGRQFLVQRFALATAPGLHLIEPRPATALSDRALVAGLSAPAQGFAALPHVASELDELGRLYTTQRLQDETFTAPAVQQAMDQNLFSVVHIASHGRFEGEARNSFLLTYDSRIGMDALELIVKSGRFREEPVDLLTLSACETAAGDERAALGLAGVAIKAGARSVVATLWLVDDTASSLLIGAFYRELREGHRSKAQAMQAAQLKLMADARYRHPAYWAPMLVIGNWL